MTTTHRRDYGLLGEDGRLAAEAGLANADWYRCPVDRKRMKQLMQRSDRPAIVSSLLWLGLMIGLAIIGVMTWVSWWSIPIFIAYGVLWGSGGDSRCHETGHGTAFKTRWMNDVIYQISCFSTMREPIVRKWDHTRHHTDTVIVGRDREIIEECPPRLLHLLGFWFGIPQVYGQLTGTIRHAFGRMADDEKLIIPETEWRKVIWQGRILLSIHVGLVVLAIALGTILPLMLTSFATVYGTWFSVYVGLIQHVGLAEDVTDFRLNSRTCYMNPVFRFVYWNMNYHLEHHMFPMVPNHNLKHLHEDLKFDCPPPYTSTLQAYREIIPTLRRQLIDPAHYVHRPLPATLTHTAHD